MAARAMPSNTLFHLVPVNALSREILGHDDNKHLISKARTGGLGIEIGFHITKRPGRVIARVGRDADVLLTEPEISAVHVVFEYNPQTCVVVLVNKSRHPESVVITPRRSNPLTKGRPISEEPEIVRHSQVLSYGRDYQVNIARRYRFILVWRNAATTKALRELTTQDYHGAQQQIVPQRHRGTQEIPSELHTWHNTRLRWVNHRQIREADRDDPRPEVADGTFGVVYKAADRQTGNVFAVKVLRSGPFANTDQTRGAAHREVTILAQLDHKNIIECLGHAKLDTNEPEIYMPLREGNLRSLVARVQERPDAVSELCDQVLRQILSGLDYLAGKRICHRDVKPENILYWDRTGNGEYVLQLADFGLATHQTLASGRCGTANYSAPELSTKFAVVNQSPKMDVWSLFVTTIDIHPDINFPPEGRPTRRIVTELVFEAVRKMPVFAPMVQVKPHLRASAAQMLMLLFDGEGLSSSKDHIPPLTDEQWVIPSIEEDFDKATDAIDRSMPTIRNPDTRQVIGEGALSKVLLCLKEDRGTVPWHTQHLSNEKRAFDQDVHMASVVTVDSNQMSYAYDRY